MQYDETNDIDLCSAEFRVGVKRGIIWDVIVHDIH